MLKSNEVLKKNALVIPGMLLSTYKKNKTFYRYLRICEVEYSLQFVD